MLLELELEIKSHLAQYYPNVSLSFYKTLKWENYWIVLVKGSSPVLKNVNLFIWDVVEKSLVPTANVLVADPEVGTVCVNLWLNEDGKPMAKSLSGIDIEIDPTTGKLNPLTPDERPW